MKKVFEFLFCRWKREIKGTGSEKWTSNKFIGGVKLPNSTTHYIRDYVEYKYTNKFDGSTKIKREYLN